ncbi:hypothetical protein ACIQ9P_03800 [Kitasatospora sp. NPDC094019]|uniref:hypothetical protein n=1 Tax=Kitasatospora sp. NPDC094019 TaxID=3364091 RepID=UPI003820E71B
MTISSLPVALPGITARGYRLAGLGIQPLALPRARHLFLLVNADTGITVRTATSGRTTSFQVETVVGYERATSLAEVRRLETVRSVVRLAKWAGRLHPRLIDMIAGALASDEPLATALAELDAHMRHMLLAAIATDLPEVEPTPWQSDFDRRLDRLLSGLALARTRTQFLTPPTTAASEDPPPEPHCGPDILPLTMACGIRRRTIPIVPRTPHLGPRAHGGTGYRLAA